MDRKLSIKKPIYKYFKIITSIIAIMIFLLLMRLLILNSFTTTSVNRNELRFAKVKKHNLISSFICEGKVIPQNTYQLETPVSGKVEQVYIKIGDFVNMGDTLIVMSNDDLQLQLINSEIEVANQINNLSTAKIQRNQSSISHRRHLFTLQNQLSKLQREIAGNNELFAKQLISEDTYLTKQEEYLILQNDFSLSSEEARIDSLMRMQQISQIEQSLNQVQNNLRQMKNKVFDLIIKAPISGQITELNPTIGQMLVSGSKVAFIENKETYYLQSKINQYYQNHLQIGTKALLTGFNDTLFVEIDNIHPRLDGSNLIVDFKGDLPQNLRTGQSVNLEIQTSITDNVLTIPIGEYLAGNNYKSVFVLNTNETKAERKYIETGNRSISDIEIISGLIEGDKIIITSNPKWSKKNTIKLK